MNREKTLKKIDRLELHAYCLKAKVACGPHPAATNRLPIRRPAMIALAERLMAKATLLREGLEITEAARKAERDVRKQKKGHSFDGRARAKRARMLRGLSGGLVARQAGGRGLAGDEGYRGAGALGRLTEGPIHLRRAAARRLGWRFDHGTVPVIPGSELACFLHSHSVLRRRSGESSPNSPDDFHLLFALPAGTCPDCRIARKGTL